MTIQIASSSFIVDSSKFPPAATPEAAQTLLTKFTADIAADKFDQADESFDGYELYVKEVIRTNRNHPPFPVYPKYKTV
jgi:hypothetical protein